MIKITFFGYGTLINPQSLKEDVPEYSNLRLGYLEGYRRIFGKKAGKTFTDDGKPISVLDVVRKPGFNTNGVIYDAPLEYYQSLKARERAYNLVKMPINLNSGKTEEAIVCIHKDEAIYDYIEDPLQEWYLDVCLKGAQELGMEFYDEFIKSTYIGN